MEARRFATELMLLFSFFTLESLVFNITAYDVVSYFLLKINYMLLSGIIYVMVITALQSFILNLYLMVKNREEVKSFEDILENFAYYGLNYFLFLSILNFAIFFSINSMYSSIYLSGVEEMPNIQQRYFTLVSLLILALFAGLVYFYTSRVLDLPTKRKLLLSIALAPLLSIVYLILYGILTSYAPQNQIVYFFLNALAITLGFLIVTKICERL